MSLGLYIHVPFCIKKCSYCDFVSYPYDAGLAASYVYSLEKEMQFHVTSLREDQRLLNSIYIGGGTPTCLEGEQFTAVLENCRKYFFISDGAEITAECNPGTINQNKVNKMRRAGVNRISIGVQAYHQEMLTKLGRIHNWRDVEMAVSLCRKAGFDNLSLDLIFGIPGQSLKDWQQTLQMVTDLGPEHISTYNLTIEPGTPLYRDIAAGKITPCNEELELEMFWYTIEFLTSHGFKHYEISNFARAGLESRHNLIYWLNEEYLGLGPAAHSMINKHRFSNVESVELYIKRLMNNESVIAEDSILTRQEQISETAFLGLRLIDGLDLEIFEQRFGQNFNGLFAKQLKKLIDYGLVEISGKRLKLTSRGLPVANEVFAEFI